MGDTVGGCHGGRCLATSGLFGLLGLRVAKLARASDEEVKRHLLKQRSSIIRLPGHTCSQALSAVPSSLK